MKTLLVVDLCGTLVRRNTTHDFMRYAALGPMRRIAAFLILSRPAGFLFSRINTELQRKCLIACLMGVRQSDLARWGLEYARTTLASHSRDEVLERIRMAEQRGMIVVLASASLDFIVSGFAQVLGIDAAVSTRLVYSEGQCCRGIIERDSTGRKLDLLREYIGADDFEFEVITDNAEDSDLMDVASDVWFIHAQD